jgi:hypothetical protein
MKPLLLAVLLVAYPDGVMYKGKLRESNPLAPSLPKLTEQEEKEFTEIVDRFIDADTGKLKGTAASKAVADFKALGAEATFQLLEGLNRAANMEDSCPAVLIAKKLSTIINGSKDPELLDITRDLIGTGVTAKRHQVVLKDLRLACTMRKAALQRAEIAAGKGPNPDVGGGKKGEKTPKNMTTPELTGAAVKLRGEELRPILLELATRKGDQVVATLGSIAAKEDRAAQELARTLLAEVLSGQSADDLKVWLKKGSPEVRAAAARVIGDKGYKLIDELIAALADADEAVRQAAREALVKLASNQADHGPEIGASPSERTQSQQRWRDFWQKKK